MNSEVPCVLVSLGTQGQLQIILKTDYLPSCLSNSYDDNQNTKILMLGKIHFKKGVNLVIIWGFAHFVFLE